MTIIIAIIIGLVASYAGSRSQIPGGAIVVPILAVIAWQLVGGRGGVRYPGWLQVVTFGLLAASVGMSIDRSSLGELRSQWPVLLLMAVSVYAAATLCMVLIARLAHIDLATALLAGTPGGYAGVTGISVGAGVDLLQVITVQTLRLLIIYASLPLILLSIRPRG